ncbi:aldo/keto reductase [Candidatus Leptofilum sp.]|uniref:aldo/keto reductase n=1 Tax=Candidatus Leptofilum sp. TaxID=3241576 RepID=UPI003B5A5A9D
MNPKPFGQTNLTVTPIGLGLAALGRPGYINLGHAQDLNHNYDVAAMEAHAHTVLDAAWKAGIRYFDAARSYGRAEAFLASWLNSRRIAPANITVGSKWGYTYTADWQVNVPEGQKHEVKDHTLPVLQRQWQESQANLGEQLNLYQIHSATLDSGVLNNHAVLTELARLRNAGTLIGLSLSGTGQAETLWRALEIEFDGKPLFGAVQATWNILEQSATAVLTAAHQVGLGVIIKEALANGRLTSRNNAPSFQPQMEILTQLAKQQHTSVDALALAAILNQPFVDVVLSGAARTDHLLSNIEAINVNWQPELAEILLEMGEETAVYWQTRSNLPWN